MSAPQLTPAEIHTRLAELQLAANEIVSKALALGVEIGSVQPEPARHEQRPTAPVLRLVHSVREAS